ncbi:YidH family protein [Cytobacillus sp. Hz8]|uniref:YidH family protein n=1 Tax=Cytobacillus sp. Hz8 TaxID=3347168 RepID=UPI0035DCC6A1
MNDPQNISISSKNSQIQSVDSKYIQQHLANERTYLAWIRTSVTIMGVGFLITNLHFSTPNLKIQMADLLAKIIGLASISVGILALMFSTISYFQKGKEINRQTFHFSRSVVVFLSFSLILVFLVFGLYYLYVWQLI